MICFRIYSKLKKLVNTRHDDWDQYIDGVMFSMITKHQLSIKYSPFETMYGQKAIHFMNSKEPLAKEILSSYYVLFPISCGGLFSNLNKTNKIIILIGRMRSH